MTLYIIDALNVDLAQRKESLKWQGVWQARSH